MAIRIDGPRAWDDVLLVDWVLTDEDQRYRMELSNGVLIHFPTARERPADLVVHLTRPQLVGLLLGGATEGVALDGDAGVLATLVGLVEEPDRNFAIVTP